MCYYFIAFFTFNFSSFAALILFKSAIFVRPRFLSSQHSFSCLSWWVSILFHLRSFGFCLNEDLPCALTLKWLFTFFIISISFSICVTPNWNRCDRWRTPHLQRSLQQRAPLLLLVHTKTRGILVSKGIWLTIEWELANNIDIRNRALVYSRAILREASCHLFFTVVPKLYLP